MFANGLYRLRSYGCQRANLEDGVTLLLAWKVFPTTRKYPLPIARSWEKIQHAVRDEIDPDIIFIDQKTFDSECQRRLAYAQELIQDSEANEIQPLKYISEWRGEVSIPRKAETPLIKNAKKDRHFFNFTKDIDANYKKIQDLPPVILEKPKHNLYPKPIVPHTDPLQGEKSQEKKPEKKKTPTKQKAKIIPFKLRAPVE